MNYASLLTISTFFFPLMPAHMTSIWFITSTLVFGCSVPRPLGLCVGSIEEWFRYQVVLDSTKVPSEGAINSSLFSITLTEGEKMASFSSPSSKI